MQLGPSGPLALGFGLTTIQVSPTEMVKTPATASGAPAPSRARATGSANPGPEVHGPDAGPVPASYEDALAELERLVASMEAGQLPLESMLEGYRRGARLLAFCRQRLEAVEQQVKLLEDGELKPWTEGA